jgi:protein TonB
MQVAGLAVSALATAAAGYLMMNSFGNFVGVFAPPESTTLSTILPEKAPEPPPQQFDRPEDEVKLASPTVLAAPEEKFVYEEKKDTAITGVAVDIPIGGELKAAVPPPKMVRIAPKLRSLEKPPYPLIDQRARNEGLTTLSLCVDARGRVSSANLAKSSGHSRLDESALKWIKDARFSPGTVDGAAQAVCGHTVVYEWRLEDIR